MLLAAWHLAATECRGNNPKRQRLKRYPIGFFHLDITEVQTFEGKLYLFGAIYRTSKLAVTQLEKKADRRNGPGAPGESAGGCSLLEPHDFDCCGIQFADQVQDRNTAFSRQMRFGMI